MQKAGSPGLASSLLPFPRAVCVPMPLCQAGPWLLSHHGCVLPCRDVPEKLDWGCWHLVSLRKLKPGLSPSTLDELWAGGLPPHPQQKKCLAPAAIPLVKCLYGHQAAAQDAGDRV